VYVVRVAAHVVFVFSASCVCRVVGMCLLRVPCEFWVHVVNMYVFAACCMSSVHFVYFLLTLFVCCAYDVVCMFASVVRRYLCVAWLLIACCVYCACCACVCFVLVVLYCVCIVRILCLYCVCGVYGVYVMSVLCASCVYVVQLCVCSVLCMFCVLWVCYVYVVSVLYQYA